MQAWFVNIVTLQPYTLQVEPVPDRPGRVSPADGGGVTYLLGRDCHATAAEAVAAAEALRQRLVERAERRAADLRSKTIAAEGVAA